MYFFILFREIYISPWQPHTHTQTDRSCKRKRKGKRIKCNKHTKRVENKRRHQWQVARLGGIARRLLPLDQWTNEFKLRPSVLGDGRWRRGEVAGVGREKEESEIWYSHFLSSYSSFYFLIFLFPFSSSLSGGLGCNLGTRRLMAGQSPLDVASVRFLTSLCPQ